MIKTESSVKELNREIKDVYTFLSDFRNLESHIPQDKIRNFNADENSCSFQVDMIGDAFIQITDKEPFKTIKFSGNENKPYPFTMWVQLRESSRDKTYMKLTLHAEVNMMIRMIVEPILKNGLETIADRISGFINSQQG